MRLRRFFSLAPIAVLTAGLVIGTSAFQTIRESNAAGVESEYLPALAVFDQSITLREIASPIKPKRGDFVGTLVIPRLKKSIRIYEGTESAQLKLGAGHYEKSVLPGVKDNSVIAGHRDSVFTEFDKLAHGDLLIVTTSYGKFVYTIKKFRIVMANDRTVIVPTNIAMLTLSTCYPFNFIGSAPKRFIVSAALTSTN